MGHQFLSATWAAEARKRLDASPQFRQAVKDTTAALLTIATDAPGGTIYMYQEFEAGQLKRMDVGRDATWTERPVLLKIRATYDTFAAINRGEVSMVGAFLGGKIKIEGDVKKALAFAPAFRQYTETVRVVETEY